MGSPYDRLSENDQRAMRAHWQREIDEAVAKLNLRSEFIAEGRSWTEADRDGNAVKRGPMSLDDAPQNSED